MKKLIFSIMAMVAASVVTSCDKLVEIGVLPEPTKYFIEMNMTYDEFLEAFGEGFLEISVDYIPFSVFSNCLV